MELSPEEVNRLSPGEHLQDRERSVTWEDLKAALEQR
jgi:hypothetical protein